MNLEVPVPSPGRHIASAEAPVAGRLSRKVQLAKQSVTGLWHDLYKGFHILSMGGLFVSRVVAFPDPRVFS